MKTFEQVWQEQEEAGYQYSDSNVEKVKFGWELAMKEIARLEENIDVANISQGCTVLTIEKNELPAFFENEGFEDGDQYTVSFGTMTRKQFEELPEFDGF